MTVPTTSTARPALPWREHLFRELVRLAWPIMVSNLSFTVMTVVDTAFVGRLGSAALAGVGLGGIALWTVICFGFGLLRVVKVLSAQAIGAGEGERVTAYVGAGLYVAFALGLLAIAVGLPVAGCLPTFSASAEAGRIAELYMTLRLIGAPTALVACALREARYGVGDSRSPMYAALISNAVHIPLNYMLIFHFKLGITGAAVASLLVQLLELGWLAQRQWGTGFGLQRARLSHVREVMRLGSPVGSEFLLGIGAFSMLVLLVARMSEADLAAHQVALQIAHFAFMPAVAIGEAASVLTGQAVGADQDRYVRAVARSAFRLAAVYASLCALAFVLGASALTRLFATDPNVGRIATHLLYVAAGFQLFDAANIVARAALRGTGDVRMPAILAILSAWFFIPTLTWFWGIHSGLGAVGGWLALTCDIVFGALVLWWRLERNHWLAAARLSRERLDSGALLPAE